MRRELYAFLPLAIALGLYLSVLRDKLSSSELPRVLSAEPRGAQISAEPRGAQISAEDYNCTPPVLPRTPGTGKVALVTGAAGFIASHVALECAKLGMTVVAVDDLSGGYVENIPRHKSVKFMQGDVKDPKFVADLFAAYKFDYVYHLAAYAAEGLSHFIRSFNYRNNLVASVELLNQAVKHDVDCFVFTSSIAVYGSGRTPLKESMIPMPEDPYGIAKYAMELDLLSAQHMFGTEYVVFRPHNVYGPHQNLFDRYRNVIGIFMNQILRDLPMTIFGDGEQMRAFSYIDDVAPLIALSPLIPEARKQIFNIGADVPFTVNELAYEVARAMGVAKKVDNQPARKEVKEAHSDHSKIKCIFQPPPAVPLRQGLERMVSWWKTKDLKSTMAPVIFDAVEVLQNIPPSWKHDTMVEAPRVDISGKPALVPNNLPAPLQAECVMCVPPEFIEGQRKRAGAVLAAERPALWREPGKGNSKTLVTIHVALGMWEITQMMLVTLASLDDESFDVLLIDDHSKGNDINLLAAQWGVTTLAWGNKGDPPKGLTNSWNLAWRYFLDHPEYSNIIVCNNDLMVPHGSITKLARALDAGWAMLLPIVSETRSAYPGHRLKNWYNNSGADKAAHWTNQVLNFQAVQGAIDAAGPSQTREIVEPEVLLNGYMMGFSRLMEAHQFDKARYLLFDPKNINVGNEGELCVRIKGKVPMGVHTGAYVFHFKGYTLSTTTNGDRNDISVMSASNKKDPKLNGLNQANSPTADASGWSFEKYVPSLLEEKWIANGAEWQETLCTQVDQQREQIDTWLSSCAAQKADDPTHTVMSAFVYKHTDGRTEEHYIEPLAAALRHPRSFCNGPIRYCNSYKECRAHGEAGMSPMLSRESWILLSPPPPVSAGPQSRQILFDLGASSYQNGPGGRSTAWFVDEYTPHGVTFDHIYGWEAKPYEPVKYWKEVPVGVKAVLHYFNHPASADVDSPENPLSLLALVCRPTDFCVVKIDVHVSELEDRWLKQIRTDPKLFSVIDVLFYEHHVGVPHEMARLWWGPDRYPGSITDSFELFSDLRSKGIQMHSWP